MTRTRTFTCGLRDGLDCPTDAPLIDSRAFTLGATIGRKVANRRDSK